MNDQIIKASALVAGGLGVGTVAGYFIAVKRLEAKYAAIADAEIQSVKDRQKLIRKEDEFASPEAAHAALHVEETEEVTMDTIYGKTLGQLGYLSEVAPSDLVDALPFVTEEDLADIERKTRKLVVDDEEEEFVEDPQVVHEREQAAAYEKLMALRAKEEEEPEIINIWDTPQDMDDEEVSQPWGPDVEGHDALVPYWIPVEEFMSDSKGFDKMTITYYEGDDTLVDDREQLVPDVEAIVGVAQLDRFGQGSSDPHTVYVRNEELQADFEVVREEGAYSVMVLGMDESLLDPQERRPRVRKSRDDRDDR